MIGMALIIFKKIFIEDIILKCECEILKKSYRSRSEYQNITKCAMRKGYILDIKRACI